ncbi:MAG: hypothetical protein Q8O89_01920 [Nanoarchaeota archaeon]|nr:hypothetical protein [Nanoarchaeota archaeon]
MDCSWTNLPQCITGYFTDYFFNYLLGILNSPVNLFLGFIHKLLSEPVNIEIFHPTWLVIIYILSFFYIIIFIYAGFQFITSANNPIKREDAKEWLKNAFFLIVFVQASFFIYSSVLLLASSLAGGILSGIDTSFFTITPDGSVGIQIMLLIPYLITLLITALILGVRYILASIGLIFFTLGIFAYFIPPIKDIGKFLVTVVLMILFVPFFQAIMILAISKIVQNFTDYKILILICGFLLINIATIALVYFVTIKSALGLSRLR